MVDQIETKLPSQTPQEPVKPQGGKEVQITRIKDSQSNTIEQTPEFQSATDRLKEKRERIERVLPPELHGKSPQEQLSYILQKEAGPRRALIEEIRSKIATLKNNPSDGLLTDINTGMQEIGISEDFSTDMKHVYTDLINATVAELASKDSNLLDMLVRSNKERQVLARSGPKAPIQEIFLEDDPRFDLLPPRVKEAIRATNALLKHSFSTLTEHSLEGVQKGIAGAAPLPGPAAAEALEDVKSIVLPALEELVKSQEKQSSIKEQAGRYLPRDEKEKLGDLDEAYKDRIDAGNALNQVRPSEAELKSGARNQSLHDLVHSIQSSTKSGDLQPLIDQLELLRRSGTLAGQDVLYAEKAADFATTHKAYMQQERGVMEAMTGGVRGERSYLQKYVEDTDWTWVQSTLENPNKVIELLQTKESYEEFERRVKKIYNSVFRDADNNTNQQFDHVFSSMYHAPALEEVIRALHDALNLSMTDQLKNEKVGGPRQEEDMRYEVVLRRLISRLQTERDLRRYTHNVSFILQTRGTLETLAGFAEQVRATDLDSLFHGDPLVMQAAQFFEQKVNQILASNNWVVPQEFMQPDTDLGGSKVDIEVMEMLEKHYKDRLKLDPKNDPRALERWQLSRAYRLARGIHLGATAVVMDRIGEADPPTKDEVGGYKGYFGEKIASAWNPLRHIFHRWNTPNDLHHLMYALIRDHGTRHGWNHKQLKEVEAEMKKRRGSEQWEYMLQIGGTPFIEFRNLFGVGGPMTRGGWRLDAATYHMLQATPGTRLSDIENGTQIITEGGVDKKVSLKDVDWEVSWENFKRGGSAVMWYWTDAAGGKPYKGEDGKEHHMGSKKDLKREVYNHIRNMNPLKFAFFEKEEMFDSKFVKKDDKNTTLFRNSIRGRAIGHMLTTLQKKDAALGTFKLGGKDVDIHSYQWTVDNPNKEDDWKGKIKTFHEVKGLATMVEENLLRVQGKALTRAQDDFDLRKNRFDKGLDPDKKWANNVVWRITEADFNVIEDVAERRLAVEYWRGLMKAIDTKEYMMAVEKDHGHDAHAGGHGHHAPPPKTELKWVDALTYFSQRQHDFFIGSEDMDMSQLKFQRAGASIVGRAFGDAYTLSAGIGELGHIDEILFAADQKKDMHVLGEYIHKVVGPIKAVHGAEKESKVARMLATVIARYYQKDWMVRTLPEPLGALSDYIWNSSASSDRVGKRSWNWTENETREFIDLLRHEGILESHDVDIARKEIGARDIQVFGIDFMRTAVPIVFLLLLLQAFRAETSEGSGGGGHH